MAYGIKYQFRLESINGAEYTVNISKDGYSGAVTKRPLGKAPILKKVENGRIHSTSLDLVLECQVDGEYSEFYNASPGTYTVELYKGNSQIWQGSLVTELYAAPEIAPPYDVKVSANDGIALAKESPYDAQGEITPLNLVKYLLAGVPGLGRSIYIVSGIGGADVTPATFWTTARINLDYMAGESRYDVLTYFLETIHATITMHDGNWFLYRETDVSVSGGSIPCFLAPRNSSSMSSTSITGAAQSAGQMGVASLWPIGHMNTEVVPAKRRVTIEAPFHATSGIPPMGNLGWTIHDHSHAVFQGGTCILTYATLDDDYGEVYTQLSVRSFTKRLVLSFRASSYLGYVYPEDVDLKVYVTFTPSGGSPMYYNGIAWVSEGEELDNPSLPKAVGTTDMTVDLSYDVQPISEFLDGTLDITFVGRRAQVSEVYLNADLGAGYKDILVINNGARGDGDTVEIAGGRVSNGDVVAASFLQGIFLKADGAPVENFYDSNFSGNLSFMSLTALGHALSVALPRMDLSSTFNFPSNVSTIPLVVTYGGVNYWVESFELNVQDEELRLTARSLPAASLSVESETVTELPKEDTRGGSSSGGGGGGGSYTLPVASATTLGGVKVGSGLAIDGSGVLSATGGGSGGGTVTSVAMTVPTGMTIGGSPITSAGTLALGLSTGSTIPTSADVEKGVTAYGWGNHADAGYAYESESGNYVTLHTTQNNISGEKTFTTHPVHIGASSGLDVNGSSYIDIGDARLKWDGDNHALHVTKRPGSSYAGSISIYADGDVGGGGPGNGSTVNYVNCASETAYNNISTKDPATIYTIGTAPSFSKVYLGSILLYSAS